MPGIQVFTSTISIAMCQHIVVLKRFYYKDLSFICIYNTLFVLPIRGVQRLGSALQWINHYLLVYYYQNPDSQNSNVSRDPRIEF